MKVLFKDVLIADDCETTRLRLSKELNLLGYVVHTACDGAEALSKLESKDYDFLITDWDMPNIDGETLCRCLRASQKPQYVYTIMMTAHSNLVDVVTGMNAGADDFIIKPFDNRELAARMSNGSRVLALDRNLRELATHDPLTGVLNRRTFISGIAEQMESCRRRGAPLSCIMLDIDHFKYLNDQFGHIAGDNVLVAVARQLRNRFRNSDFVFRFGGEEFTVILNGADEMAASKCAEKCRTELEQLVFSAHEGLRLTVSCGVAEFESGVTPLELTDRADLALREAKSSGRNQTVRYSECSLAAQHQVSHCLLYTSPSPRDATLSRMPSSA